MGYKTSMAERVGFEPTRERKPPTRFPGVHLRPLGHLSMYSVLPLLQDRFFGSFIHNLPQFEKNPL